jgi:hypothetical protein
MDRPSRNRKIASWNRLLGTACLVLLAGGASGCSILPGFGSADPHRAEAERLLHEYRAERQRADELEAQNRRMTSRLFELEHRLAQLHAQGGALPAERIAQGGPAGPAGSTAPFSAPAPLAAQPSAATVSPPIRAHADPLSPPEDRWRATPGNPAIH